ncbi:MAG: RdgB/HAM1 family non-canonical purine NTP pyrophosphatase [Nocardioides sp.]
MTEVVLASRNHKKLAELERILRGHLPDIHVLGLDDVSAYDEPVEDEPTFEGNALLKARAALAVTGLPSIADDSGLCVAALNGMPGVLSARWAGRPRSDDRNNQLLLDQLADVPDERRAAHFACAIACCLPGGATLVEHGEMRGRVIRELRGEGGFGYDVLFVPDEYAAAGPGGHGLTSAELDQQAKDAISHRGRALRRLAPLLAELLSVSPPG